MCRILLVGDTHGNLDIINEKVEQVQADFIIHAGDFGFYDQDSVRRLSAAIPLLERIYNQRYASTKS